MSDIKMSREELLVKLINVAYKVLKPCGYDLRTLAVYILTCEEEFGLSEAEKTDIASRLTAKVMSNGNGSGRRKTD